MNGSPKYGLLRTIARVLKIIAWIVLAVGLIAAIVALTSMGGSADTLTRALNGVLAVVGPLMGIIWFLQLFALGSVISLLIDIEENTRLLAAQPPAPRAR